MQATGKEAGVTSSNVQLYAQDSKGHLILARRKEKEIARESCNFGSEYTCYVNRKRRILSSDEENCL